MTREACFICGKPATHPSTPIRHAPHSDDGRPLCFTEPKCDRHVAWHEKPHESRRYTRRRKAPTR
jgi:hypothetical protein